MSAGELPERFVLDLKAYRQDQGGSRNIAVGADFLDDPPTGLYDPDEVSMLEAMRAVAPILGRLAAASGLRTDVHLLHIQTLKEGGAKLVSEDAGHLIWGRHGDYASWRDSRGDGPQDTYLASGLALTHSGRLEEFVVAPDIRMLEDGGYLPRTYIISVRNDGVAGDRQTGDHWPVETADDLRVGGGSVRKFYHGLISFADLVVGPG